MISPRIRESPTRSSRYSTIRPPRRSTISGPPSRPCPAASAVSKTSPSTSPWCAMKRSRLRPAGSVCVLRRARHRRRTCWRRGLARHPRDLASFLRGTSPASILAREFGIERLVVNCGLVGEPEQGTHVYRVCEGALDFALGTAMTENQLNTALEIGVSLAEDAAQRFDCVAIAQLGSSAPSLNWPLIFRKSSERACELALMAGE